MENWKDINIKILKDYEVSDLGNIRHKKFKRLIKFRNLRGHLTFRYKTSKGSGCFLVHRLVAISFIPNPKNLPIVNHINGIRSDNRVENLEWSSNTQNVVHGIIRRKGSTNSKFKKIEDLYKSKKWNSADDLYKQIMIQIFNTNY